MRTSPSGFCAWQNNDMTYRAPIIAVLVSVILLMTAAPFFAHAQTNQTPGFKALTKDADKIFGQVPVGGSVDVGSFVNRAFKIALSIGAILAVLRLAWAGYQYMSTDAWGEKSHAKEILGDVVIGLLMLLSIYLVLYQINPQILSMKFNGQNLVPTREQR